MAEGRRPQRLAAWRRVWPRNIAWQSSAQVPRALSAAARAAEIDRRSNRAAPSYVLIEASAAPARTIQHYQRGKHVMAEPGFLDLRSDLRFNAGKRERVLDVWQEDLARLNVNVRYGCRVQRISGRLGAFSIETQASEVLDAENVVLAIGLEGNPRKIGVRGDALNAVQYQLDDPKAFVDESIIVVGAGDAAIENALALSEQNDVWLVNRGKEFSRAKDKNLSDVLAAINDRGSRLECCYETRIKEIRLLADARLSVLLETAAGEQSLECHRIIARLGAEPPRRFVESIGIGFPNTRNDAIPELTRRYESNVDGVFIVGSLAGYPLIKQAMNQGYDRR